MSLVAVPAALQTMVPPTPRVAATAAAPFCIVSGQAPASKRKAAASSSH